MIAPIMAKRVTLQTIAEATGLAKPSVSQILNGHGTYPEATRARVIAAAKRLGYRKHAGAEGMIRGSLRAIALLLAPEERDSLLPSALLDGIERACAENRYLLNLARLPEQATEDVPRVLEQLLVDGLLILYNARVPQRMIDIIHEHRVPVIWLNDRRARDAAYPDDHQAGRVATAHLLDLGHRRVAWCCANWPRGVEPGHYSAIDRRAGYRAAMVEAGLEPCELVPERELRPEDRVAWLHAVLAASDRPEALVCYNGEDAHAAYVAAVAQGLQPGRDLSLVQIDDRQRSPIGVQFTTALLPFADLGRRAVDLLIARIANQSRPAKSIVLPVQLLPGATSGPPRR
jgi:LacI family transcriptional regulator